MRAGDWCDRRTPRPSFKARPRAPGNPDFETSNLETPELRNLGTRNFETALLHRPQEQVHGSGRDFAAVLDPLIDGATKVNPDEDA